MSRRKPLLIGALALGAGVLAGLKARRGSAPSLPPPPEPAPPPAAERAAEPPPPAKPPVEPPEKESKPAPRSRSSAAKPKPKSPAKGEGAAKPAASRTRDELYREAKRLGIEGRSKMSKTELERAVAKARGN